MHSFTFQISSNNYHALFHQTITNYHLNGLGLYLHLGRRRRKEVIGYFCLIKYFKVIFIWLIFCLCKNMLIALNSVNKPCFPLFSTYELCINIKKYKIDCVSLYMSIFPVGDIRSYTIQSSLSSPSYFVIVFIIL